MAAFSKWASQTTVGVEIDVVMTEAGTNFLACYRTGACAQRQLVFNLTVLGREWFRGPAEEIVDLVIHELGHEIEGNHLSEKYYRALTMIGGKLFANARDAPKLLSSSNRED